MFDRELSAKSKYLKRRMMRYIEVYLFLAKTRFLNDLRHSSTQNRGNSVFVLVPGTRFSLCTDHGISAPGRSVSFSPKSVFGRGVS